MWYEICQEDMYVIQGALMGQIDTLKHIGRGRDVINRIAELKRISDKLYDEGKSNKTDN